MTLKECYTFMFVTMIQRSWPSEPTSIAARSVFGCIIIFASVCFWYWEAMLVSYLATKVIVLPFTSIPELIKSTDYRVAVNPGSSQEDSFKLSNDPNWALVYTERIEPYLEEYRKYKPIYDMSILDNDTKTAVYCDYFTGM
jgi:hypothetical protein